MTENYIGLKPIKEILGMNFFIPNYQRGYRWTKQQVKDLLDDINEFIEKKDKGIYCIQPLVIKEQKQETFDLIKNEAKNIEEIEKLLKGSWEVIDGQQRLTTIFILLTYLDCENKYNLKYATREDSESFLLSIDHGKKEDNIDYYHIIEAKEQITKWFTENGNDLEIFKNTLLNKVNFIWYESVDENPIAVFTRLNIGKIPLTNAELIKALFLNKSNFESNDFKKIRLQQQEIASEWDHIEYNLQSDEFWMFLHEQNYDKPTRIDFIFDLICNHNSLKLNEEEMKDIGKDEYKTFRYFYAWFKRKTDITECWKEVKSYHQIFQEWFNDLELYHYIGFMIENKIDISTIIKEWKKEGRTKNDFTKQYIIPSLKFKIAKCSDLNKQYEIENSPKKTQSRPLLLLYNIQTVINQNEGIKDNAKYKLPVFYKFPFHLYKREAWDVEHIDSNTENQLEDEKDQKKWLKCSYSHISDNDLKLEIEKFLIDAEDKKDFDYLRAKVIANTTSASVKLNNEEKNKLWNFTLLDASTNRSYGNDIFPMKRIVIIGKDQGKKIAINDDVADFEIHQIPGEIAFIPPCTKNVFLKYYSPNTDNLREWDKSDANTYLKNIETVLEKFLKDE